MGAPNHGEPLTCWMPLSPAPLCRGPLAVCRGSHVLNEKGVPSNVEELPEGCAKAATVGGAKAATVSGADDISPPASSPRITPHRFDHDYVAHSDWRSGSVDVGDVVVMMPWLVHASMENKEPALRISCDCRWIRLSTAEDTGADVKPLRPAASMARS